MDRKDEPPAYSEAAAQNQSQNLYQYPAQANYGQAQTNYGFGAQQPTNFGSAAQPSIVVSSVSSVGVSSMHSAPPQDYTTQAWLACLCCFWPTGLMAIMKSNESRDALARGDMIGAHQAANNARQMVRISFGVGLVSIIITVVIVIVYVVVLTSYINDNPYDD